MRFLLIVLVCSLSFTTYAAPEPPADGDQKVIYVRVEFGGKAKGIRVFKGGSINLIPSTSMNWDGLAMETLKFMNEMVDKGYEVEELSFTDNGYVRSMILVKE